MITTPNATPGRDSGESWDRVDDDDLIEKNSFGLRHVRWSKTAGQAMVRRTSMNRILGQYEPLFVLFGEEVYETQPSDLYVALEQLPLEGASDQAVRAYVALREIVVSDIVHEAHHAIHDALDEL